MSPKFSLPKPRSSRAPEEGRFSSFALLQSVVVTASVGFFATVVIISHIEPDYFEDRVLATMSGAEIDPIMTAATEAAAAPHDGVEALPVPVAPVRDLQPSDYQIVMIFGDEAHIAAPDQLLRVQVGSEVPGLGRILAIEPGAEGGRIEAERATLVGVVR